MDAALKAQILDALKDGSKAEKEIKGLVSRHECTKPLGGEAYKVCFENACSGCAVLKLNVSENEVKLLEKVERFVKDHELFSHTVMRYVDSVPYNPDKRTFVVMTELISGPTLQRKLQDLSFFDLVHLIAIVCLTLEYLHREADLLHMDMKGDNIVLRPWIFGDSLTIQTKEYGDITIPRMEYFPVVIDFGNATDGEIFGTSVYSDSGFPWKGHCYFPGFDIVRLFLNIRENTGLNFFKEMGISIGRSDYETTYLMLTANGCEKFKRIFPKYTSVFRYSPFASLTHTDKKPEPYHFPF